MSEAQLSFSSVCFQGQVEKLLGDQIVVDHTNVLEQLDASHRNLSSGFVASQMFAKIVEILLMSLSPLSWQLRRNLGTR
jgi:hypothetical protein